MSQFEALSLSQCKRKSGDKMSCVSCHDPHQEPAPVEKAAFYRAKCLNCHGEAFAAKHFPGQRDCTQCHMPRLPDEAVAHTQSTDHRILRRPNGPQIPGSPPTHNLAPFPDTTASLVGTRDLALAWERLAPRLPDEGLPLAERYLRLAVQERPEDPALLEALGFLEQQHGRKAEARELYQRALKIDPTNNGSATNLGAIEAQSGNLAHAIELLRGALERVPNRSAVGIDLAIIYCAKGEPGTAQGYVQRVLDFNPDSSTAKRFLANLKSDPVQCQP